MLGKFQGNLVFPKTEGIGKMDGRMCVTGYRRNHQFYEWAEAGYTSSKKCN